MESKPIQGFEHYKVFEDGTVKNKYGYNLIIDSHGCITIHTMNKRKTFSVPRLVAINWLGMPDDKKHQAYKKDKNGGYGKDNIAWDNLTILTRDRLMKARKAKHEYNKQCEEELYEEMIE